MAKVIEKDKLLDGLSLTDEQRTAMDAILGNDANLETFSRRFLRREEGSRLAQEAQAAKDKAEREYRESEAYRQTLTEWEQEKIREFTEKEAALRKPDPANPLLDPLAPSQPQIDVDALRKDVSKGMMSLDMAKGLADIAMEVPLHVPRLMAQHQRLYGTVEADWSKLVPLAKQNLISGKYADVGAAVDAAAEQAFSFSTKEKELADAAVQAQITKGIEDGVIARMSAMKIPGAELNRAVSDDKLFGSEYAEAAMRLTPDATERERTDVVDAAYNDFLRANQELAAQGVHMEH